MSTQNSLHDSSIGFVGLGDMGGPIAHRIAAAGFALAVWSRGVHSLAELAGQPYVAVNSLRELGRQCDIVAICVFGDDDVRDVVLGADGLVAAMSPSSVLVIHSTVSVALCREIAAAGASRGVHVLDAPVSGARVGAVNGTLTIMVGGDPSVRDRITPLLTSYGQVIRWMGPVGSGQKMKMLNNVLAFANGALANTAIETGVALGLDPASVLAVLESGSAASSALDSLVHTLIPDPVYTAHAATMIAKDTRLFQEQCRRDELAPTVLEQLAVERITHPVPDVSLATPASAVARGPRTPVTPPRVRTRPDDRRNHVRHRQNSGPVDATAATTRGDGEMTSIVVGQYRITALSDGMSRLPPMFFPGLDPCQHGAGSDPDGTIHIPTGCFLIQGAGRTILVDAGLGPVTLPFPDGMPTARTVAGRATPPLSEGGDLPAQLRAAGVESSDVDTVLLTHLHGDHIGWVAPRGAPYFDAATVMFGEPDWTVLIENGPPTDPGVQGMKIARDRGRLQTITTETHSIAPGVTVHRAPGHTAGSYIVVIAAGRDRAYLLGDVVQHPLQLDDESIAFLTDLDPALATRTRQRVFDAMEREHAAIGMDHFPGLGFQQIIAGAPRKWLPV